MKTIFASFLCAIWLIASVANAEPTTLSPVEKTTGVDVRLNETAEVASETYIEHTIVAGDVLERLAKVLTPHQKIYGRGGVLEKAIVLNPGLKPKRGNLLTIGDVIRLPGAKDAEKPEVRATTSDQILEAHWVQRKIEKGDSLSEILYDLNKGRAVYGPNGTLDLTLKKNPELQANAGDKLEIGQIVIVPSTLITQNDVANEDDDEDKPRRPSSEEKTALPPGPMAEAAAEAVKRAFSVIEFSAGANYFLVTGFDPKTNSYGRLTSRLVPNAKLAWKQNWAGDVSSEIYLLARRVELEAEKTGLDIGGVPSNEIGFGAAASAPLTTRLRAHLAIEKQSEIFYHASSSTKLEIDEVPLLRVHPALELTVAKLDPLTVSLKAGYSYYESSYYNHYGISAGRGWDVSARVMQDFDQKKVGCSVGYSERQQNTDLLNLSEKDIGLMCQMGWNL